MIPIVATLLSEGLSLIGNAVLAKGKEWVEEKAGVKLPDNGKPIPPEDLLKLKQMEMEHEEELLRLRLEDNKLDIEIFKVEVQNASDVNKTMQVEAISEHWPQWAWRPFIGFSFGASFFICCLLVCILAYMAVINRDREAMNMIPDVITAFAALFALPLPVLGVAAYHRGKEKIQRLLGKGEK